MQSNELNTLLAQYSNAAKGQTHRYSAAELVGYAAAASASLAMAGSADASIIYSGVQNITVQTMPIVLTTENAASNSVITSNPEQPTSSNASAGSQSILSSGGSVVASTNPPTTNQSSTFLTSSPAQTGTTGTQQTSQGQGLSSNTNSVVGSLSPGLVVGSFKPITFDYSWVTLAATGIESVSASRSATPMMFNMAVPNSISGGGAQINQQSTVPEPSSLALLAAGAAGINAFRRRKAAKAAL
jgi:hypothetical protein